MFHPFVLTLLKSRFNEALTMVVDTVPTKQLLLDYAEPTVCKSAWLCDSQTGVPAA